MFNGKTHYKWPFSIAMLVYQRVFGNNLQTLSRLAEASREQVRTLEDCAGHSWPCGCGGGGQGLGDVRQWHLFRLPTGCCDWAHWTMVKLGQMLGVDWASRWMH